MYRHDGQLIVAPTDLVTFLQSPFASWMDRRKAEGAPDLEPDPEPASDQMLARLGEAHEQRVLAAYRGSGASVEIIEKPKRKAARRAAVAATEAALARGPDVVFQAALEGPLPGLPGARLCGFADFLVRGPGGDDEVLDAKLARAPKPEFIIQLCAYAELLARLVGDLPPTLGIIDGHGETRRFRTEAFVHVHRDLVERFADFHWSFGGRPAPDPGARHGRWQSHADAFFEKIDHLCRVARITRRQTSRLEEAGVRTRAALAKRRARVPGLDPEQLRRLRTQAKLQVASVGRERPRFERLPVEPGARRGLGLLPPPSPGDMVLDFEGDPLGETPLDYLFGVLLFGEREVEYCRWWAHTPREEARAFEALVDLATRRLDAHPDMHIYHYGHYEVSALRRMMGAHATREEALDRLLRSNVFVNLQLVVQQGLQVGTASLSLKDVERLVRPAREEAVADALDSMVQYEKWLALPPSEAKKRRAILDDIERYNRADCQSTADLCAWLREQQARAGAVWVPPARAGGETTARAVAAEEALAAELRAGLPETCPDAGPERERWQLRTLMAALVGFHRREDKPAWWRLFDGLETSTDALLEDPDALAGLARTEHPPEANGRSRIVRYAFDPDQDTKIEVGDVARFGPSPQEEVQVHALDRDRGMAALKVGPSKMDPPARVNLFLKDVVNTQPLRASLARTARAVLDDRPLPPALRDLLLRAPPRIEGLPRGAPIPVGADPVPDARAAVLDLEDSVLAIQGPPGTGKTHTAAECAAAVLAMKERVAVSGPSHASIVQLMAKILERARGLGLTVSAVKVGGRGQAELPEGIRAARRIEGSAQLVGGTAWAFAKETIERFDYLFVDEAGQVSLANLVAMAPAADNIVLVGDQMQLSQPVKGTHPGVSGRSALDVHLGGEATVPPERGIFLSRTRRLCGPLCRFLSETMYEGRLERAEDVPERTLMHATGVELPPRGVSFLPVHHENCTRSSEAEADAIHRLIGQLLRSRDASEPATPRLRADDIMIVAPYNAQVRLLKRKLPDVRVGTVDKFQGQEAKVVLVSLCASDADCAPRGLDFILDPNRINVALSRAEALAVVVGSPRLAEAPARSLKQLRLLNLFARLRREHLDIGALEPRPRAAS